jgi:ribosomal protein S18 acetylase RimI-like enzyme
MSRVRPYSSRDKAGLAAGIVALQDYERDISPDRVPGAKVCARYLKWVLKNCRGRRGAIFVADDGKRISGYACARVQHSMCSGPSPFAYITDLWVHADVRRQGLGRALLRAVERWARARGFRRVELSVLVVNRVARSAYRDYGYEVHEQTLWKCW